MNRQGLAIISLIVSLGVTIGGLVVADSVMKANLGVGLVDLLNFMLEIDKTMEDAPVLNEGLNLSSALYQELSLEKGNLTNMFSMAEDSLESVNNNPDVTKVLRAALGQNYTIYLFTVYNNSFKVFDWTIGVSNGSITRFEPGMTGSPDVMVQLDHEVLSELMGGSVTPEIIKTLVKEKQLKVNPILEAGRVINALPEIIEIVNRYTEQAAAMAQQI